MLPAATFDNPQDGRVTHPEFAGQCRTAVRRTVALVSATNLSHLFRGQLGQVLFLAFGLSALLIAVGHVVLMRPEKQMRWVHASGVIATVQNEEAIGDGAEVEFPGEAVSLSKFSVVVESSVGFSDLTTRPHPTLTADRVYWPALVNLWPESLGVGKRFWIAGRTVSLPPHVVGSAQTTRDKGPVATFDGTGKEVVDPWHGTRSRVDSEEVRGRPVSSRLFGCDPSRKGNYTAA